MGDHAPVRLGLHQAREIAELAVQERGAEHGYTPIMLDGRERCVYFDGEGRPSCLVGHILHRAGLAAEVLIGSRLNEMSPDELQDEGIIDVSGPTLDFLSALQASQDHGVQWGHAVDAANQYLLETFPEEFTNAEVEPLQEEAHDEGFVQAGR